MSPRSAYLLLDAPGADGFAEAWDKAIDEGVEPRHSDALAIALIGGQDKSIDDYSRTAASRRRYRQDMAELDRQREEEQRRKDQVWAGHQAILDQLEFDRLLKRGRPEPRIRQL